MSSRRMLPAELTLHDSTSKDYHRDLIVVIPGHVISGRLVTRGFLPKLTDFADVLVVEHPTTGPFDFTQEALQIADEVDKLKPYRLYIVGMSMGSVVAAYMAKTLKSPDLEALQRGGIIAECGMCDLHDIKGPLQYWWFWRWPRFINAYAMKWMNKHNPHFFVEGVVTANIREYWSAQSSFPNSGRRGQMKAIAELPSLILGELEDAKVPVRYIGSRVDPLTREQAAERYVRIFGPVTPEAIKFTPNGWHCAHPEQPSIWDGLLLGALASLGLKGCSE